MKKAPIILTISFMICLTACSNVDTHVESAVDTTSIAVSSPQTSAPALTDALPTTMPPH